ncbi:MAG TPA: NDP-sugar synthase [Candidatus Xenobia bacterium]|jgi:NDP-sugar pyrophosphorylase family protein
MILAAGGGTRLHPLTYQIPKPMVPIANVPVMEHIIRLLARHGFQEIAVNLHYLPQYITDYFGDGSSLGVRLHYSREEELMGTAGGVRKLRDFLQDDDFLIIGGDDLTDFDLSAMMAHHKKAGALATIGLTEAEDTTQYGVVVLDSQDRITRFQEKPKPEEALSHLVNTGVYFFSPRIFDWIPAGVYDFGRQLFPRILEEHQPFFGVRAPGYWCDIGNPGEYWRASMDALEGRVQLHMPGDRRNQAWVEDDAQVADDAHISGPVVIGRGVVVGRDARLEGPVILGHDVKVGPSATVSRSVLWRQVDVGQNATVSRSLLGERARVEPGHRVTDRVVGTENEAETHLVGAPA